jgi:hypothetical protein
MYGWMEECNNGKDSGLLLLLINLGLSLKCSIYNKYSNNNDYALVVKQCLYSS